MESFSFLSSFLCFFIVFSLVHSHLLVHNLTNHIFVHVQVWMVVQRKWMYLESIFIGGDIRAQLPEEARKFDDIDKTFKKVGYISTLSFSGPCRTN